MREEGKERQSFLVSIKAGFCSGHTGVVVDLFLAIFLGIACILLDNVRTRNIQEHFRNFVYNVSLIA
ncbi:hypothetical protein CP10139811_1650, partial [Chlamydia ibidis]